MKTKPRKKRYYGPAIYKVQEVVLPYSGRFKCYRFLVAIPNMAGNKPFTSIPAPSFRKPFLQFMSSDFQEHEMDKVVTRLISLFERSGFSPMEPVDDFAERMSIAMQPVVVDHIPHIEEGVTV